MSRINESRMAQMKRPGMSDASRPSAPQSESSEQPSHQGQQGQQGQQNSTDLQSQPVLPKPPTPHVPIYNPMAKRAAPVNAGTVDLPSSMIPSSVKKHSKEPTPINNPFASIAPMPQEEEQPEVSVPGPQLRFTLVPYGEQSLSDDDSSEKESENDNKETDADFASFMKKINSLPSYIVYSTNTQETTTLHTVRFCEETNASKGENPHTRRKTLPTAQTKGNIRDCS